jgi:hypothetical protein
LKKQHPEAQLDHAFVQTPVRNSIPADGFETNTAKITTPHSQHVIENSSTPGISVLGMEATILP